MADVIATQAVDRAQVLHEGILALQIVIKLYMESTTHGHLADETIYVVDHLIEPLVQPAEDLLKMLREVLNAAD